MRAVLAVLVSLVVAGAAQAQPPQQAPQARTIQCVETSGQIVPAVCQVPGSRLDPREFICTCPAGGFRVEVAICPDGVAPPPEGRALITARREGLKDGSLVGDRMNGRPICVAPRRP